MRHAGHRSPGNPAAPRDREIVEGLSLILHNLASYALLLTILALPPPARCFRAYFTASVAKPRALAAFRQGPGRASTLHGMEGLLHNFVLGRVKSDISYRQGVHPLLP
jgi:hypothetical protein